MVIVVDVVVAVDGIVTVEVGIVVVVVVVVDDDDDDDDQDRRRRIS